MPGGVVSFWLDRDWEKYPPRNIIERGSRIYKKLVYEPLKNLRSYLLTLRSEPYYWYHKQYRRVPTIDQCYTHDIICQYEADQQFERDRRVDSAIVALLKQRTTDCMIWESQDRQRCEPLFDILHEAETNFFIKYGDMSASATSKDALMKQKHRMVWERRHGPVGTGMKTAHLRKDGSVYYE